MAFLKVLASKLSSRKLWLAIAGVATGVAVALGANSTDVNTISTSVQTVIGCITALASVVTYIKTEGTIDAANVSKATEAVQTAVTEIQAAVSAVNGQTDDSESEESNENKG